MKYSICAYFDILLHRHLMTLSRCLGRENLSTIMIPRLADPGREAGVHLQNLVAPTSATNHTCYICLLTPRQSVSQAAALVEALKSSGPVSSYDGVETTNVDDGYEYVVSFVRRYFEKHKSTKKRADVDARD